MICDIIYGFNDLKQINMNLPVILVEPRKNILDKIKGVLPKNVNLYPKMIINKNIVSEVFMYTYKENNCEYINYTELSNDIKKISHKIVSNERVFTTSLQNLILYNKIKKINNIFWNLNTDNTIECIDTLIPFSYIIQNIQIIKNEKPMSSGLLQDYFEKSDICNEDNVNIINYTIIPNGNLNSIPIYLFLTQSVQEKHKDRFELLQLHYNIKLIQSHNIDLCCNTKVYFYEKLNNIYKMLFEKIDTSEFCIIAQFNPNVLEKNYTFKFNLNCYDKMLYVDKNNDIIYGNKDTFYNLYEVINSDYFKDTMNDIKIKKKEFMFKLFNKRYFYEYISSIFDVIEPLN